MSDKLVVYESKYGHTKRYAESIAKALGCECFRKSEAPPSLKGYRCIVFGGSLYASGWAGVSWLNKHINELKEKSLVLFTCGLADPTNEQNAQHIRKAVEKQLSSPLFEKSKLFLLRGGIDYAKLSPLHRAMMAMMVFSLRRKSSTQLSEEDHGIIESYGQKVNFFCPSAIDPLVAYVKGLSF